MFRLYRRSANQQLLDRLHGEIVAAARNPVLFTDYAIQDTFEGRFEMVTLHAALLLRRLNQTPHPGPEIAQDLANAVFRHFDVALREMGVGDTSVPKRMKTLAEAFFGRSAAYDEALQRDETALAAALARNVYAGQGNSSHLTRYVQAIDAVLTAMPLQTILGSELLFPEPSSIL